MHNGEQLFVRFYEYGPLSIWLRTTCPAGFTRTGLDFNPADLPEAEAADMAPVEPVAYYWVELSRYTHWSDTFLFNVFPIWTIY